MAWKGLNIKRKSEVSGNNILADTSLLINFFNGIEPTDEVLKDQHIWISAITEMELLSFSALTDAHEQLIRSFLDGCMLVEISRPIREIAIQIRKKQKLKLPDAVIAATSIYLDFPLLTMDTDFNKVTHLNVVIVNSES